MIYAAALATVFLVSFLWGSGFRPRARGSSLAESEAALQRASKLLAELAATTELEEAA